MRRLLLGVGLVAALVGCESPKDGVGSSIGAYSLFDPAAVNPSLCGGPAIPFPNNALFSGTTDATLNIPNSSNAPFVTAANLTDGFSTTASIFTDVLGQIDYTSAAEAVLIFNTATGEFLVPNVDFVVQPSTAMATVSGTGTATGLCVSTGLPQKFQPISQQRSRLLIEPLKPLRPSTTYIVAVTRGLKSVDGIATTTNEFFPIVSGSTKICDLNVSDAAVLDCSDPAAAAEAATRLNAPVLAGPAMGAPYSTGGAPLTGAAAIVARMTTLETLRTQLLAPTVTALKGAYQAEFGTALANDDLVIAWNFTTQSVGLTLSRLDTSADAAGFQVANTTISTGDLGLGLSDYADIWAGVIQVPYYLKNASGAATDPLSNAWVNDGTLNDVVFPPFAALGAMCSGFANTATNSTTVCRPDPAVQSTESVAVLVAVPNNNVCTPNPTLCGGDATVDKPAAGWPVVVFQHGITRNRTDMLALAPTLTAAGFVVVAIDQPLHGVTNNSANIATNPFYENQIFTNPAFGGAFDGLLTGERTFDLDLADNTPAANPAIPTPANPCVAANSQPDGTIDSSGTHFVNLANLIVARDNLRQSEADLLHVIRSLGSLDLDQNSGNLTTTDINEAVVRFAGQSLGAIVGTTVMGLDIGASATADESDELVGAAALNVPGGGLGKLLDASAAFGPRISGGLSCSFVYEGTDTYETFVRFAQHLVDPADPINYAKAAADNHPVLVTEVIGDAVVPNNAASTCPAASALPPLSATAAAVDPAGTAAASGAVTVAQVAASGAAGAALVAQCPPLTMPADPPLAAFTYQDETVITGHLSGTDALVDIMGITAVVSMGNAPFAAQANGSGDTLVVFAPDTAEHGSLLTPNASANATQPNTTFLPATCAQQKQTATFLASNGALLPIGGTCP